MYGRVLTDFDISKVHGSEWPIIHRHHKLALHTATGKIHGPQRRVGIVGRERDDSGITSGRIRVETHDDACRSSRDYLRSGGFDDGKRPGLRREHARINSYARAPRVTKCDRILYGA